MLRCPHCLSENLKRDGHTAAGTQRYRCLELHCSKGFVQAIGLEQLDQRMDREQIRQNVKSVSKHEVFIITSAQNATPVYNTGLETLKRICEHMKGQLIIQPYRYRNPNSIFTDKDHDWWEKEVEPYLIDERVHLHENLILLGDLKIIPTAINPLRGLQGLTSNESVILGHPKIDMETVATRQGEMAKIMQTTGTITVQNYTDSGAGKKGIHHHSYGAVLVEIDGDRFHMRTIQIDQEGCVIDMDKKYHPDGHVEYARADAVVLGDVHHWWMDKAAEGALFGSDGLIPTVRPHKIVYHDLIDSYSISHHHRGDPFIRCAKHKFNYGSIRQELEDAVNFVEKSTPDYSVPVIVNSNHHDHIARYIRETDWRSDPENAEFYLETALHMLQKTRMYEGGAKVPDPFSYWIKKLCDNLVVMEPDESLQVHSFELGMHGHLGPNGSRGTAASLSRIGSKAIVGHYHSPCRKAGLLAVGTLTVPNMDYTVGPSSWMQSCVLIYENGKASHVHLIDGRFRK